MHQSGKVGADVVDRLGTAERVDVIVAFSAPGMNPRDLAATEAAVTAARDDILRSLSPDEIEIHHTYSLVNGFSGAVTTAGVLRLMAHPKVLRVDLDLPIHAQATEAVPIVHLDGLQAIGLTGAGVRVAIIDTGYDAAHPDLADDLVAEACFCRVGGGCCPMHGAVEFGPGSAQDDNGHGTNVSGIVTGRGTVAPIGGAPDAQVVAIKVLAADGSGSTDDAIMALNHILATEPNVRVVNMSLGTDALFPGACDAVPGVTMMYATVINMLRARGTLVVASSGNQRSFTQMEAPACVTNAVAVGATYDDVFGTFVYPLEGIRFGCTDPVTRVDQITCFSDVNAQTDLLAPGSLLTSTGLGGGVSTFRGTSQAAPLVTACAAALLEHDPTLTPAAIEAALEASPVRITDPRNGVVVPRLDCQLALVRLGAGRTCRFDVNGDGVPDLVLHDTDGNGLCELPPAKTHLHGTLVFTTDTPIELRGNTVLEADRIVLEPGAVIFGERATLRSLRLVATTGAIESQGRLDLKASDDLFVRAATAVRLEGRTELVAADIVEVDARRGDLRIVPPVMQTPFAALGGNRATLRSKGAVGVIAVGRARVGGPRVSVDGVANLSVVGTKGVVVAVRGMLTTDPSRTGLPPGGGDLSVSTTGRVVLSGDDVVDAVRTLRIATARPGDDLCLELRTLLEARDAKGIAQSIDLTRVRGIVFDDGTTTFVGTVASNGIVQGVCP